MEPVLIDTSEDNGLIKFNGPHKILISGNNLAEINYTQKITIGNMQTCGNSIVVRPTDTNGESK